MNESSRDPVERDPFEEAQLDDPTMSTLLQRARNGDADARGRLVSDLQAYLAFIASHQLDPHMRAKVGPSDIVQQSMIRAIDNLDRFQGETIDELRAWLRKILINETRQQRRDLHARKRDVSREQRIADAPSDAAAIDFADSLPTPGTRAASEEQSRAVQRALAKLPEKDRLIIQWRTWEDLTFETIGSRLGMTANAVSKRWYRGLIEFKKHLNHDDE